jgi:D-alanyl-D-alanine-carboxypeptidase/D-alanyl-D-alanine-endopeptidase
MRKIADICGAVLLAFALTLGLAPVPAAAQAKDKLLEEAIEFTGTLLFEEAKVPGMVIGAVRKGETFVKGFGKARRGQDHTPDGATAFRIGSITKVFAGAVLASLVADGTVRFTDTLQSRLGWDVPIPKRDGREIRLIDLATHTSGLPREVERAPAPADDPFKTITKEAMIQNLRSEPLLYTPGTGALYSNFAFDLLAQALANAAGKPYEDLLRERVLAPAGMTSTVFTLSAEQKSRSMQGHNFDGTAMADAPTPSTIVGSGGLHSTADDMLKWIKWHLDRNSPNQTEMRFLDQAAYVQRDGLSPVFGLDESGRMDAMGLGWVVMTPYGDRPSILQKAGGLQGMFSYVAVAPVRGIGVFAAINQFNLTSFEKMVTISNELIATLAPR